jgi:hypothetical protein
VSVVARAAPLLVAALLSLVTTACAGEATSSAEWSAGRGRPSEAEAREAYLNTPLVAAATGRVIALGSTRAEVTDAVGAPSSFTYRRGRRAQHGDCVLYPIAGTQRRDSFGGIEADEWEFCFGPAGRLSSKRRIRAGS